MDTIDTSGMFTAGGHFKIRGPNTHKTTNFPNFFANSTETKIVVAW